MTQSDRSRDLASRARNAQGEHDHEIMTRVRRLPRTGTKVTTIVGASLLACAVYLLFAPVYMDTANGWFGCGNFIHGSDVDFVNRACRGATDRNGALALLSGALAVIVGGLGTVLFGFDVEVDSKRFPRDRTRDQGSRKDPGRDGRGSSGSRREGDLPTRPTRRAPSAWDD